MHDCGENSQLRTRLACWFDSSLGGSLQATEVSRLREILPRLFGPVAVQFGWLGRLEMLGCSLAATRIVVDETPGEGMETPWVQARLEAVPLETKSVHLVLLPHALEFADDPHQVLREAARVLQPEGHLVIVGFNPVSLWGLWRLVRKRGRRVPWCGRFLSLTRVKDWLGLLGCEVVGGSMLYYRPPVSRDGLRDRLYRFEHAGSRWWPLLGAVYVVVARKRELGMTALRPEWRRRKRLAPRLVNPVTRRMRRGQG